ncbi:dehydrodolichyl diphosphate synthase CPT5, chloroplastic-like [Phragmites australis]|uniref:dehydrodolichyl diphosphate synthase CPT5, chloroplastic-like n=1 Tax=Phragmites australis TaxID=29695 RepID=UPI002D7A0878|nr:dehydrodolichyl diphosphate synthase CPT5, chloroplastic-like [Phragmites australis]
MLLSRSPSATTTRRPAPPTRSQRARLPPPCARGGMGAAADAAEALLQSGLRPESLPRHVAVVMDGNSRWARARGLPPADGHTAGGRNLERIVLLSRAWGIRALTAFVCSHENLNRPKAEVDYMMGLSEWLIDDNIDKLSRQGIRLQVIGDPSKQPVSLQSAAVKADEATRNNSQLHVMLAICYSGRWDMVQACRELARKVQDNQLSPDDIDESLLAGMVATSVAGEFSCPDLIIRTSGELRLSNFLLWQSAYSELFFTDTMWPDFGETEYLQALSSFQSRERRFGQNKS